MFIKFFLFAVQAALYLLSFLRFKSYDYAQRTIYYISCIQYIMYTYIQSALHMMLLHAARSTERAHTPNKGHPNRLCVKCIQLVCD